MTRLLLEGGAEFGGQMAQPDRAALALAGGSDAPVVIIPTAAAPDRNHERAGRNGVRWFESLGAKNVRVAPLIDRDSASRPDVANLLRSARLVYLLGGFTHYLAQTLAGSPAWAAVLEARQAGAVIAGSSAGAMVLAGHYYDPGSGQVHAGLGLVMNACVLPHYNTFGNRWVDRLSGLLPDTILIGLDEQTGILAADEPGDWRVLGAGAATCIERGSVTVYPRGTAFRHAPPLARSRTSSG